MTVSVQITQSVDVSNGNIILSFIGNNLPISFPISLGFTYTASALTFDQISFSGTSSSSLSSVSNGHSGTVSISGSVSTSSSTFSTITFHGAGTGTFNLDVSQFKIAGSNVIFTDPPAINFDFSMPTVTSFSPVDALTGVAIDSNIVLNFSEAIQKGTGTIAIHSGSAAGPVMESYNAATSTNLAISGSMLTINPSNDLEYGTKYFVTLGEGTLKDPAGNSYAGTTSYNFTTSATTDHPLMSPVTHNGVNVDPVRYSGPAKAAEEETIHFQFIGDSSGEVLIGTSNNDFISVGAGVDAVNSGAGNDVVDGGIDSNFLTGGAGTDIFFSDGRGGGITWSTITDWQAGEQLSVWGWKPGISRIVEWVQAGATNYEGLTMHADLDGNDVIDTSVTFTGITSQSQLPTPLDQFDNLLWFQ